VVTRANQLYAVIGASIREERLRRGWTLREFSRRSGLSLARVHAIESGAAASVDAYVRLATALGLRLNVDLADPTSKERQGLHRSADVVHSAMGELEAAHLRKLGFPVGLDEPYQHFQFAGRADVAAWDIDRRALVLLENRTQVPDFQEAAGSYNAKRAYLAESIGARVGVSRWASETHVMVGLWAAEMLHGLRLRPNSFRSLCPDSNASFLAWWRGEPPTGGHTSTLIVLDPAATGRQRLFIDEALTARPRYRDYAAAAAALASRA
jgi:transcriptional regulator with XRE-family HTH domain